MSDAAQLAALAAEACDDVAEGAEHRAARATPEAQLARVAATDACDRCVGRTSIRDARASAKRSACDDDAAAARGPLHGIGIGVKDIIAHAIAADAHGLADLRRTSRRRPMPRALQRLRAAGAYVFGKTVTTALAFMRSRQDAQSVERAAHAGRIVAGLGGGGGGRARAGRARHADQRLGDPAGGVLRRRRLQAHARRDPVRRRQSRSARRSTRSARSRAHVADAALLASALADRAALPATSRRVASPPRLAYLVALSVDAPDCDADDIARRGR